jgi:pimeloyl-ACP methyl ester carboxylesterase
MRPLAACCLAFVAGACRAADARASRPAAEVRQARAEDGLGLAYEVSGSGSPALVFVHGWAGERGLWRATMAALATEHRVLALDLAGHGESDAERAEWSLAAWAGDIATVVRAEGLEDCVLVGHSLGAPLALLAAPLLAPRVRAVVAVESLHDAAFVYPPEALAMAAAELERDFPRTLEGHLRATFGPKLSPELGDWLVARALRTDRGAARGTLLALQDFALAPALAAARVPVRALNAAPPARLATAVEANRRFADFDALLLTGVGHFPMLEDPPAFRSALRHVLSELGSPATAR